MRNVTLKLAASLLAFLTAAGPAAAADRKNYAGSACQPWSDSITSIRRSAQRGHAYNTSTSTVAFICPVVKDYTSIASARAYVVDEHAEDQVACRLRSGRIGGSALWGSTAVSGISDHGSDAVELIFSGTGAPADSLGFYWLTCDVPGTYGGFASGILMYQVIENE